MKNLIITLVAIFAVSAHASGGKAPAQFECKFSPPREHPMQKEGPPYVGRGATTAIATANALAGCEDEMHDWIANYCSSYMKDAELTKCSLTSTVREEADRD